MRSGRKGGLCGRKWPGGHEGLEDLFQFWDDLFGLDGMVNIWQI